MDFDVYSFHSNDKNKINTQIITNKDRIYQYIKNNPGTHLRKIKKDLGLAMGDIQYNLNVLEKLDLIKYRRISIYKHYYIKSISGNRNEMVLAILQQETPRAIVMCLLEFPGSSQKEISQNLALSIPTIKWHLSKLFEMKLIYFHNEGRTIKCYLSGDSKDFIKMLRSYHPSLLNRLSNTMMDVFIELSSVTILDADNDNDNNLNNSLSAEETEELDSNLHKKKDKGKKI
ncbi:MAG: winged helix-turn-helix transcriptional regulator [Candidatus Nitrosocosmicus sp.]